MESRPSSAATAKVRQDASLRSMYQGRSMVTSLPPLLLGGEPGEVEAVGELDPELARLGPAQPSR